MAKKRTDTNTQLIVTSNDLILAKYNFSLWQKRVFNYFVSQIDKDATEFSTQRVYISDLIRFFNAGDGREVYEIITNVPKQLYNLSIKIPYVSDEGYQRFGEMRIITRYTKPEDRESGNAYIEFKFNDDLKPHLLELKRRFLKYDLHNIVGLQSTHSIRMFEILKSYEYLGAVTLEVEQLKTVLELGDKYKLYADFRRYVIDKAQEDLTKFCDITFDYEEIKQSRRVSEIRFMIKKNQVEKNDSALLRHSSKKNRQSEPFFSEEKRVGEVVENTDWAELSERVNTWWGVSKTEFLKRAKDKTPSDVEVAINFTKEKMQEGKAKNPAGVFLDALTKGFKTFKQHADEQKKDLKARAEAQKAKISPLLEAYRNVNDQMLNDVNNHIRALIEHDPSLTQTAIDQVTKSFIATKRAHLVKINRSKILERTQRCVKPLSKSSKIYFLKILRLSNSRIWFN
ncbi:MAG: replication initiation protein [Saprospiraceae bacterium]|nr:replication initiation protein [Saprospiraceae bacterium]